MYDNSGTYANGVSNYLVSNGAVNEVTFTLPPGTGALYVYSGWECNCGGPGSSPPTAESITATAQDGTSSGPVSVALGHPSYFGFYAASGTCLQTVELSFTGQPWTLIAGAFGIAPAPAGCTNGTTTTGTGTTTTGAGPPNQQAALMQACEGAADDANSALGDGGFDSEVDVDQPGALTATVVYDGSGGGSVLTYEGPGGGSVLTYNGSSGGSVLTYEGSSGGSVLTYEGSGGGSVLTYEGSGGGSSVLTYNGSGGGSSVAADPGGGPTVASETTAVSCQSNFDGAGGGSSVAVDLTVARAAATRAVGKDRVRLCLRKRRHAKPRCISLRRIALPPVAQLTEKVAKTGETPIRIPLSTLGRMLLIAGRSADTVYRHKNPHGLRPPRLGLKLTLNITPTG